MINVYKIEENFYTYIFRCENSTFIKDINSKIGGTN